MCSEDVYFGSNILGDKNMLDGLVKTLVTCAREVASVVSDSATLWTIAHQAPLFMGFSMQGYWSGSPCPPPGDLPNPGIEPRSHTHLLLQVGSLPLVPPENPEEPRGQWKVIETLS